MPSLLKERLLELILEGAFKYNDEPVFRLTSGRMSNYYFNCKAVALHPEGMHLIGNIIFDLIKDLNIKGIGGLTLGADPIAYAVAYTSYRRGTPVDAFVIRKTPKSHGISSALGGGGQWIEGNVKKGDRVVIVEDVITTGKSTIEAITRAKEEGLEIVKVIALIDRQEGGREAVETSGYKVESVITKDEVMELYRKGMT